MLSLIFFQMDAQDTTKSKKSDKDERKAERAAQLAEQQRVAALELSKEVEDVEKDDYGYLPLCDSSKRTKREWTSVKECSAKSAGKHVWIRARLQDKRAKGNIAFVVLRQQFYTIQCVLASNKSAVKFINSLPVESIVDVYGELTKTDVEICGATQSDAEIQMSKLFCVSKAPQELPFQLKDANQPENDDCPDDISGIIRVGQEARLDCRVLDLRTMSSQAIMRISTQVCALFREFLLEKDFIEIHSPKLIGGTSEGGSNVFKLNYFGREACLAQSPQLYKQMATSADLDRVFEIGPVFRAENSNTHRHLCEFTGLDFEMTFKEHYFEVLEIAEELFVHIFNGLNHRCADEIAAVRTHYPHVKPFKFNQDKVLRLDFTDGIQMLRDAKDADVPDDISSFDLSTTQEKLLGKLIREKYDTDFYYMINYPAAVRPFYTMQASHDKTKSNSYDFFMRGEEILSGAQRVHEKDLLKEKAVRAGIDISTIRDYIDSFALGAYPHAGIGIGLERVVMLFLG